MKPIVKPIDSDTILIPTDFTLVADTAINHAVYLAGIFKRKLTLLHVIESGLFGNDKKEEEKLNDVTQKLQKASEEIEAKTGIACSYTTTIGNIYDGIGKVADDINASFVVMGTHGVKGMQHLLGSKALKVITNANRPFVVVQNKPVSENGYKNIVLPIDFSKETKQKVFWAKELALKFNSNFYILAEHESDEFAANAVRNNLAYAEHYLKDASSSIKIEHAGKGKDFEKETLNYALKVNADLIIIMTNQSMDLKEYIVGAYERNIIANEAQIPVMTLNPVNTMLSKKGHMYNFGNF